jgi:hypothetical protein
MGRVHGDDESLIDDRSQTDYWSELEDRSAEPEFQALIRAAIDEGIIRVVPGQDGRIKIISLVDDRGIDLTSRPSPNADRASAPGAPLKPSLAHVSSSGITK